MQFSENTLIQIIIFVLGFCGFMVAKHIRKHNTTGSFLVCPIKLDCHTVIHSDYSKFFSVPVEIFGMIYYAIISLSYLFFIFTPNIPNAIKIDLIAFLISMSLVAFLFSVYLISAQIFILKKGCSWCIVSAFFSALIFILTIFTYDFDSIGRIFTH